MIDTYVAKENMMFGIRKNDEVEYDTVTKVTTLKRTGKVLPFDAKKEAAFFNYVIPKPQTTYIISETVHLTVPLELEILKGTKAIHVGKRFKVAAYQEMKIVDVSVNPAPTYSRRSRKNKYFYKVEVGNFQYKLEEISEQFLKKTQYYWFISSKGKVGKDIIGRDPDADKFRTKLKNYFATSNEANVALSKL